MSDQANSAVDPVPLPEPPDFDAYPINHWLATTAVRDGGIDLGWDDGVVSRFHPMTLRENATDGETIHPVTREQALMPHEIPGDLAALGTSIDAAGALVVDWSSGERSRFHPGWLRAHSPGLPDGDFTLPARELWGGDLQDRMPRFDGQKILADEQELGRWAEALHVYGVAIVENLGTGQDIIERVPGLLGPLRVTNFGRIFDVQTKADADSNAYTAMALPLHVDLATREYMPGMQFLHCLENGAQGGDSVVADSFFMVERLRQESPEICEALSTVPLTSANKAVDTDYRWTVPIISLDTDGDIDEFRWTPWLRAPLKADFETVDLVYRGLRRLFEMSEDPSNRVVTKLNPGEMLGFDNRRVMHGRTAFDPTTGNRALRGCYVEREELFSRLRIIARHRRAEEISRQSH